MDRLEAMAAFVAVADSASFTRGAARVGKPVSTVSRLVAALEAHLGALLLARDTRKAMLTDQGREYLAHCKRILADVDEAESALGRDAQSITGALRLTAPAVLGRMFAAQTVSAFVRDHAEVRVEISLTDRLVDLIGEGFDLAIRTGDLEDSELIVRRVGVFQRILCCSPGYLEQVGPITALDDLQRLNCLVFTRLRPLAEWPLADETGEVHRTPVSGRIVADDIDALYEAALDGAGVLLTPSWQARQDLRSGRLVPVLPQYRTPSVPVCILFPRAKLLSARVRAFVDAAAAALPAFLAE
ncbi:MAG: LysR family transcriptional regulator [Caulobacteraceae bacterium]|nr:LysR family transcriptional regulator [Caulobacteraceae bacterium]